MLLRPLHQRHNDGSGLIHQFCVIKQFQLHTNAGKGVSASNLLRIRREIEQITALFSHFLLLNAGRQQNSRQSQQKRKQTFHRLSSFSRGRRIVKIVPPPER